MSTDSLRSTEQFFRAEPCSKAPPQRRRDHSPTLARWDARLDELVSPRPQKPAARSKSWHPSTSELELRSLGQRNQGSERAGTGASTWATPGTRGEHLRVCIPPGTRLSGLSTRHLQGVGIVDLRLHFRCGDGSGGATEWAVGHGHGQIREISCDPQTRACGLMVRHLDSLGLMNIRLLCTGGLKSEWSVPVAGGDLYSTRLRPGRRAVGVELLHLPQRGIVGARMLSRR